VLERHKSVYYIGLYLYTLHRIRPINETDNVETSFIWRRTWISYSKEWISQTQRKL